MNYEELLAELQTRITADNLTGILQLLTPQNYQTIRTGLDARAGMEQRYVALRGLPGLSGLTDAQFDTFFNNPLSESEIATLVQQSLQP